MADPTMPSPHNGAKRGLRMTKPRMKISSCFRTRAGAEHFAHMRGLVETTRKREQHLLDILRRDPDATLPHPVPSKPDGGGGEQPPPLAPQAARTGIPQLLR